MAREVTALTGPEFKRPMQMSIKHRDSFGERWFRYKLVAVLPSHLRRHRGRFRYLGYAIRPCGAAMVFAIVRDEARRQIRNWNTGLDACVLRRAGRRDSR